MDKALIRNRFARAASTYRTEAVVQAHIARRMTQIMHACSFPHPPGRVLEFGCGTGGFTAVWTPEFMPCHLWLNDLCPEVRPAALEHLPNGLPVTFLEGDVEHIDLPDGLDAIVSCSALQWLDHPDAFLRRCAGLLRPGGHLAFSTFGPQNVHEVTDLTGATLPYRTADEWAAQLEATGYEVLHRSEEIHTLTFADPVSVLRHLKATGVTGIRPARWTRSSLKEFTNNYCRLHAIRPETAEDTSAEGVRLTYHPVYVVARRK